MLSSSGGFKLEPLSWIQGKAYGAPEEIVKIAAEFLYQRKMTNGAEAMVFRSGIIGFNFSECPDGLLGSVSTIEDNKYLDGGDLYKAMARAQLFRATLSNAFLACHYAVRTSHNESYRNIQIIGPNDLLSLELEQLLKSGQDALDTSKSRGVVALSGINDAFDLLEDIIRQGGSAIIQLVHGGVNRPAVYSGPAPSEGWRE